MQFKSPLRVTLLAGLTLLTSVAGAAITDTALDAAKKPPADLRANVTENDNGIRGMDEAQLVTFTASPDFGVPLISGLDFVDCHILHFDPVNEPTTVTGRFAFDGEIIGVITDTATLNTFDPHCDPGGAMVYPPAILPTNRGLEQAVAQADSVQVSQNLAGDWTRIEVTAEVDGFNDQVRVITCRDSILSCHDLAESVGWGELDIP